MHISFFAQLTSPQTSPVSTATLPEVFLEPQMYMNQVYLIFLIVSLQPWSESMLCILHACGARFLPEIRRLFLSFVCRIANRLDYMKIILSDKGLVSAYAPHFYRNLLHKRQLHICFQLKKSSVARGSRTGQFDRKLKALVVEQNF